MNEITKDHELGKRKSKGIYSNYLSSKFETGHFTERLQSLLNFFLLKSHSVVEFSRKN